MLPKKIRPFAVSAILLVLLFVSILLLTNALIQKPSVQNFFISQLSDAIGFQIRTRKIELSLWQGIGIAAYGLEARSRSGPERITASKVRIILDAGQLIKGVITPVSLHLFQPQIELTLRDGSRPIKPGQGVLKKGVPVFWIPGLQSVTMKKGRILIKDAPFDLEELSLGVNQKGPAPLTLLLRAKGKVGFRGEKVAFGLRGTLSHPKGEKRFPFADMKLETGTVPLEWIPWPESIPVKKGYLTSKVKVMGSLGGPVRVDGKIFIDSFRASLIRDDREKDFSLPDITLDFQSVIEREKVSVPSLKLSAPDLSLAIGLVLDLKEEKNPYLQLDVKSKFMALQTFKSLFPSPFLAPWVEERLFPLLNDGDIRLTRLLLKGRPDQLQDLNLADNPSALTIKTEYKNLEISGNGLKQPFRDISAEISLEKGALLVSGLKTNFGSSTIKEASLYIDGLFRGNPSFETLLDGAFDLQELIALRETELFPPDVAQQLNKMESLSGKLACRARFRYEDGWDFPQIQKGDFVFKECSIKRGELILPLLLTDAEIHIDEKNQNRFKTEGSWGNSPFKITGSLGIKGKMVTIQRADISADTDINEVMSLFYHKNHLPVKLNKSLPCRLSLYRERDRWTCKGKIDLNGAVLENDSFSMDPPGKPDMILFDLDFKPRKRINLKKFLWDLGGSSLKISGSYRLRGEEPFFMKVSTTGLSLEGLGLRFKKSGLPAQGVLTGNVEVRASRNDLSRADVVGRMEGKNISFQFGRLPSPIRACGFKLNFSNKKVAIDYLKMKIGNSPIVLSGNLRGWNGLRGEISVHSDFINISDFLPDEQGSRRDERKPVREPFMDDTSVHLTVDILQGRWKGIPWGPLTAELDLREGNIYIRNSRVLLEHGILTMNGHVKNKLEPEMLFSTHIRLIDQPIKEMVGSLGFEEEYLNGSLNMEALLFMKGRKKKELLPSLMGTATVLVKKGVINKSHTFIKVLDFLSLQNIFKRRPPDFTKKGFYFKSIGGDAVIENGVLKTENFTMNSPVMNTVATGKVDMAGKTINFNLGVQPLETIDTLVNKIPILGYALTGKEKSLLTYYFKVQGPLLTPEVKYVPFKNLGKGVAGVLKRLFFAPARIYQNFSKAPNIPKETPTKDSPWSEEDEF